MAARVMAQFDLVEMYTRERIAFLRSLTALDEKATSVLFARIDELQQLQQLLQAIGIAVGIKDHTP